MSIHAAVVVFPGSNGDRDLHETFERAGFATRYVDSREALDTEIRMVGLPGGFAYGDYWRAGMLASQAQAVQSIPAVIERGGLAIGICNGFQILVEGGLLPGGLHYNAPPNFRHRWIDIRVSEGVDTPWLYGAKPGTILHIPMAHGEGQYFHPEGERALRGRVPFTYEKNPNGSMGHAASIIDATGRILGVMPHPERASDPHLGTIDGLAMFKSAHRWLMENIR